MLKRLLIRSFALVDEVVLELDEGMTVLTGETGAGKSIIVDAVSFLLGARADREIIRSGCERTYVEGIFGIGPHPAARVFLNEQRFAPEGEELTLSRELTASGRSTCRISGTAVPITLLRQLTSLLMDIHGQHEHQSLLDEGRHLPFLDSFAQDDHADLLGRVNAAYETLRKTSLELEALRRRTRDEAERAEELHRAERELSAAKPIAGEAEALKREVERLRGADRVTRGLATVYSLLYSAPDDGETAFTLVSRAVPPLESIAGLDKAYEDIHRRVEALYFELEDLGMVVREEKDALEGDAHRLDSVEERLDLLRRLARKHGKDPEELQTYLADLQTEIARLAFADESIAERESLKEQALTKYRDLSLRLTGARKKAAALLEARMEEQLHDLNMAGARFIIAIDTDGRAPSAQGNDLVRFLLAPNPGEEPKPLARIASGGELSRLMLALKATSARRYELLSMVFDEIDAGISGKTAQTVAEKLWQIACRRQVLCVTHLHQIAAMASSHLLVEKDESDGRTVISVRKLHTSDRIQEVARLLSGMEGTQASSTAHARTLIREARTYRESTQGADKDA